MIGLVLLAPEAVVITTIQSESQLNIYSGFRSPEVWYMVPVPHSEPLIAVNMSERGLENWVLPVSRTTKRVDEIARTSGQKFTTIICTAYLVLAHDAEIVSTYSFPTLSKLKTSQLRMISCSLTWF
jgi:hypothetical protein